jgi:hypothetical protein
MSIFIFVSGFYFQSPPPGGGGVWAYALSRGVVAPVLFRVISSGMRSQPTNCIAPAYIRLWVGGTCFLFLCVLSTSTPAAHQLHRAGFVRLWHPRMHLFLSVFYYLIFTPRWWWRLAVHPFVGFPCGYSWPFLYDILYELHRLVLVWRIVWCI